MKTDFIQVNALIKENKPIAKNIYRLRLFAPGLAEKAFAGAFVNIRIAADYNPLLRRPLGVLTVVNGCLDVAYKLVGSGTRELSKKKPGSYLDVLGPLGNGFSLDFSEKEVFICAGGIGAAPLLFLAEQLSEKKIIPTVLVGAAGKDGLLFLKEFKKTGAKIYISTDDKSRGFGGNVLELFKKMREKLDNKKIVVYACGPKKMLAGFSKLAVSKNIKIYGLLEEYMACGTGICYGCVINTVFGLKRVCKDGPVFDLRILKW